MPDEVDMNIIIVIEEISKFFIKDNHKKKKKLPIMEFVNAFDWIHDFKKRLKKKQKNVLYIAK